MTARVHKAMKSISRSFKTYLAPTQYGSTQCGYGELFTWGCSVAEGASQGIWTKPTVTAKGPWPWPCYLPSFLRSPRGHLPEAPMTWLKCPYFTSHNGLTEKHGYPCLGCIYAPCHNERWLHIGYHDKGTDVQCSCMLMRHYARGGFQLQGGLSDTKGFFVTDGQWGSWGKDFAVPSWSTRYPGTEAYTGFTLLLQMCPVQVRPFTRAAREGMSPYMAMPEDRWGICLISGWLILHKEMY